MKVYLHGPREGQTVLINGVQFVNGVAEVERLSVYLERYYNVQSNPPGENVELQQDKTPEQVTQEKNEELVEAVREFNKPVEEKSKDFLKEVVELRKAVLENKGFQEIASEPVDGEALVEEMLTLKSWGAMRKFVKDKVGRDINSKEKAIEALLALGK